MLRVEPIAECTRRELTIPLEDSLAVTILFANLRSLLIVGGNKQYKGCVIVSEVLIELDDLQKAMVRFEYRVKLVRKIQLVFISV